MIRSESLPNDSVPKSVHWHIVICPDHYHNGGADTTYIFYPSYDVNESGFEILNSRDNPYVNIDLLKNKDFTSMFILQSLDKDYEEPTHAKLTSFDTTVPSQTVYPPATKFTPVYYEHPQTKTTSYIEELLSYPISTPMIYEVASFIVLLAITKAYIARCVKNHSWSKLFYDIASA
jgi:hypothetical protein